MTGSVFVRLTILSVAVVLVDGMELITFLPELLHPCHWPWEDVYGSYDRLLIILLGLEAALQVVSLMIVCLWITRRHRRIEYATKIRGTDEKKEQEEMEQALWDAFGITDTTVPLAVYVAQVVCLLLNLWILNWLKPMLLGIVLIKTVLIVLILLIEQFSPTALCWPETHRLPTRERKPDEALRSSLVLGLVTLMFLVLYGLQYGETLGSTARFLTLDQLRTLNDDLHPFNQPLRFHQTSKRLSDQLLNNTLPTKTRVLLIVLDGLGQDQFQKFPEVAQTLLGLGLGVQTVARASLPTMSVPNWATLLSGSNWTGLRGNLFPGELPFDTIYSRARRLDNYFLSSGNSRTPEFMTGMTGCPWFSSLQTSQFPRLGGGDGTLSAYSMYDLRRKSLPLPGDFDWALGNNPQAPDVDVGASQMLAILKNQEADEDWTREHSDATTDRYRLDVARQALLDPHAHFRFFLIHLSNIDTQAHRVGTRAPSFQQAVNATLSDLVQFLSQLAQHDSEFNETMVVLTADHGALDVGGHGGAQSEVVHVPLLYGRLGSNVKRSSPPVLDLADVPTTINAWLGLPVPRQTLGRFLPLAFEQPDAERDRDLFEARRELVNVYLLQTRTSAYDWCNLAVQFPVLAATNRSVTNASSDWERDLNDLDRVLTKIQSQQQTCAIVRNVVLNALFVVLVLYATTLYVWRRIPEFQTSALLVSLGILVTYLGTTLGFVLGLYVGYWGTPWDSSMVHSVPASLRFLGLALLPGTVFLGLVVARMVLPCTSIDFHVSSRQSQWSTKKREIECALCCVGTGRWMCVEYALAAGHVRSAARNWTLLVLTYLALLALYTWGILVLVQGANDFFLPFVYSNWFMDATCWTLRFRIVSVQLVCVPLLIGSGLWTWLVALGLALPDSPVRVVEHNNTGKMVSRTNPAQGHFADTWGQLPSQEVYNRHLGETLGSTFANLVPF